MRDIRLTGGATATESRACLVTAEAAGDRNTKDGRLVEIDAHSVVVAIGNGAGFVSDVGAGGRELFYVSPDFKLMVVTLKLGADSLEASVPRELFPLAALDDGWNPYHAAPDGQRFLVRATPQQQAAEPLTLIANWPALLKKGAAEQ